MTQIILSASVMIVLATLARLLAIHRLPKRIFVIIWGLISVRLLVPFSLPDAFSVLHVSNIPILEAFSVFGNTTASPDMLLIAAPSSLPAYIAGSGAEALAQPFLNWSQILLILWVLGSVSFALAFLLSHMKFRRKLRTSLPLAHPFVTDWLSEPQTSRTIQVRYSDQISSPLTYGIFRPVIVLPASMDLSDEIRLNYVLTHEHIHIRRFDYVWKLLFAAVLCVHWFNPLVWLMYMFTNRDVELSCDEAVLDLLGPKSKASYGLALLDFAEDNSRLAFASSFSKHALEERIRVMARGTRKSILGAIAVFLLISSTMMIFAAPLAEAAQAQFPPTMREPDTSIPAPVYLPQDPTALVPIRPAPHPLPAVNPALTRPSGTPHTPPLSPTDSPTEEADPPTAALANARSPSEVHLHDHDFYEYREHVWMSHTDHITITLRAFGVSSLEELELYYPDAFFLLLETMSQAQPDNSHFFDINDFPNNFVHSWPPESPDTFP